MGNKTRAQDLAVIELSSDYLQKSTVKHASAKPER